MNKRLLKILVAIFSLLLIWTMPAYADNAGPFKISNLEVSVMPEYDTSDVLVLYSINYVNTSGQPFNGEMRFPVPKGTTNNIVKETSTTNDSHLAVRVEDKGDYAEFVWKPAQPIQPNASYPIHLEYYYNPLPGTGNKSFAYQFLATLPVDQAKVNVYQPLKANNFKMEPTGQMLGQDNQGFQIYGLNSSNLKAGDKVNLKISYTKDDPNPSVQKPTAAAGATGQPGQAGSSQFSSAAVMIPMVAIVVIIILIAVKALGNREEQRVVSRRGKSPKNQGKPVNSKLAKEKRKLREMLLEGELSEETYHELLADLEEEYS